MTGKWCEAFFDQAVIINPPVNLTLGDVYPFVDMQSVDPTRRDVVPSEYREFSGGGSRFMSGDTLMARITPCLENGKIGRFLGSSESSIGHGSTEFIVLRGREGVSDNGFVYYLTRSKLVRNYAISQMSGTSGRQRVPLSALAHLRAPLPPLPEQRAIAHILGTLDDKIELNRRMNETLEAMARAIFKSWFVDFEPVRAKMEGRWRPGESLPGLPAYLYDLFPDRLVNSELGEIPEGWRVALLGDLLEFIKGKKPIETIDRPSESLYPVILIETLDTGASSMYAPSAGMVQASTDDVLMIMDGASSGRVETGHEGLVGSTIAKVIPKQNAPGKRFLYYFLKHIEPETRRHLTGTSIPHADKSWISQQRICIPSCSEILKNFEQFGDTIRKRIMANYLESRTLAALRDALLPKLINGEMRVKDAEKFWEYT